MHGAQSLGADAAGSSSRHQSPSRQAPKSYEEHDTPGSNLALIGRISPAGESGSNFGPDAMAVMAAPAEDAISTLV